MRGYRGLTCNPRRDLELILSVGFETNKIPSTQFDIWRRPAQRWVLAVAHPPLIHRAIAQTSVLALTFRPLIHRAAVLSSVLAVAHCPLIIGDLLLTCPSFGRLWNFAVLGKSGSAELQLDTATSMLSRLRTGKEVAHWGGRLPHAHEDFNRALAADPTRTSVARSLLTPRGLQSRARC